MSFPDPADAGDGNGDLSGGDGENAADVLDPKRFLNRELTWLAFNERVLQEAMDPRVPLLERLSFLAIFSSNLDEFFRVRVASLRSLLRFKKKKLKKLGFRPRRLLREIHFLVTNQQERFGNTLRNHVLPELEANGIFLVDNRNVTETQDLYIRGYLETSVLSHLVPHILTRDTQPTFLEEGGIYLAVELWSDHEISLASDGPTYGLVQVPSPPLPRFVAVPGVGHNVMFLEDVVRLSLPQLFPDHEVGSAFAVKLTRDADLYLEDEFEGDLVAKISKSLGKRATGVPSRFLYDLQAPYALISFLKEHFSLEDEDLVPGGRYHNLQDFFKFPRPRNTEALFRKPLEPLPHPTLHRAPSIREVVLEKDQILHFPYQSYDYVVRFLEEAARDESVRSIWITLYRVAKDSAIVKALLEAARRGVDVRAFVEVKARFDEARNLGWAAEMEEAGVQVFYSRPKIKVHAKIALVTRETDTGPESMAYLGTGNFNEASASIYADHGLLTADTRLTDDVEQVFRFLWEEIEVPQCQHLLVAPFTLRSGLTDLMRTEADNAQVGYVAGMALKMNSLEDGPMMDQIYQAGKAGVRINLIIRGICCIRPGYPDYGENIKGRSIVDGYLEHARIFRFVNGGDPRLFLASADLMKRNLDRRVEVAFPIYDQDIRKQLEHILHLQLSDNTKARVLDRNQQNSYVGRRVGEPRVEAQQGTYDWLSDGGDL